MKNRIGRRCLGLGVITIIALWLAVVLPALSAPSPESLVKKALTADDRYDYAGTQVLFTWTVGANDATVVRVFHSHPEATRWEFLGANREPFLVVVDDGNHRKRYQPADGIISISVSTSRDGGESGQDAFNLMKRNYTFRYAGGGEVAGRAVDVVELIPNSCGRLSERLWIDGESGVVLRTEKYRLDGSIASLSAYTQFALSPRFSADQFRLDPPKGAKVVHDPVIYWRKDMDDLRSKGYAVYVPQDLPPGFVYLNSAIIRPEDIDVVHLRFTDGLNVISLFEQPAQRGVNYVVKDSKRVTLKSGAGYLYQDCSGYLLNWTTGGVNFTLVGETPSATLVSIANSIPSPAGTGPLAWLGSMMQRMFGR